MQAVAFSPGALKGAGRAIALGALVCGVLASGIWAIVWGAENQHRGIYGGMHYGDAVGVARNAITANYGKEFADQMKFGHPDVVNHRDNSLLVGNSKVRTFNLIGRGGTRWCVTVWNPHEVWSDQKDNSGINIGGSYLIKRGCHVG